MITLLYFIATYFPYSFKESTIQSSVYYEKYMKRVVDLAQINQTEIAGQVLIALVNEASNVALRFTSKRYIHLLKTLERMCTLYVLQFKGQAQRDLVLLCQKLNKTLKLPATRSKWAELPMLSSLSQFSSAKLPEMSNVERNFMFYEPLCVPVDQTSSKEFYDILSGNELSVQRKYKEPFALMILRFEALRLWNKPECVDKQLSRLGYFILRRLLKATSQLTILSQEDGIFQELKEKTEYGLKKRKSNAREELVIPEKKAKWSCLDNEVEINLAMESEIILSSATADFRTEQTMCLPQTDIVDVETKSDKLIEMHDLNLGLTLDTSAAGYLQLLLESLNEAVLDTDAEILTKANIYYCFNHVCCCIYQIPNFDAHLTGVEKTILAIASLRALEFSRFCKENENNSNITGDEYSALHAREQELMKYYIQNKDPRLVSGLHKVYMQNICKCNNGGVCFFGNALPLKLIAFLVRSEFQQYERTDPHHFRCLCLYTLCHSQNPLSSFASLQDSDISTHLKEAFTFILTEFLDHIKDIPERDIWLLKLLDHYQKVQDGKALFYLWYSLRKISLDTASEDVKNSFLKFFLNLAEQQSKNKFDISSCRSDLRSVMPEEKEKNRYGFQYRRWHSNYSTIFSDQPDPKILLVCETILKDTSGLTVKFQQFIDILNLIRDVCTDDFQTVLSVCSYVEKKFCQPIFGDTIVAWARTVLFDASEYITPKHYKTFKEDIDKVQEYFVKYVEDGTQAFIALLNDIKGHHKTKKALISMLERAYV